MTAATRDAAAEAAPVPFNVTEMSPQARAGVARVLDSGWLTTGPEVTAFEREFAAWVGAEHAVAVSSCTAAIELSLRALALPAGAKVLVSTLTFCGAAHAIVHAGLQPVLADVDPATLMPDEATTAAAARRAGGVDALLVVHYAGQPAPVERLAAAAGLTLDRVVEDAAHALGTRVGDRQVGTLSAATCFSFYATKNLPIGEGGMVTTADPDLAGYVQVARLHGMDRDAWRRYLPGSRWGYDVELVGLKANMTDLQAAIGRGQLLHLAAWQGRREQLARRYDELLGATAGVRLPARPAGDRGTHAWHLYVVALDPALDRDQVMVELSRRGVSCSVHFTPLHHLACYRDLAGPGGAWLPVADAAARSILSLPLYPSLTHDRVDLVCRELADLCRSP